VVDGGGDVALSWLALLDRESGERRRVAVAAVFVLIGAEPRTEWLAGSVARDDRGYVLTGQDLGGNDVPGGGRCGARRSCSRPACRGLRGR
jgi:thioredoxin reductase (NADPH)